MRKSIDERWNKLIRAGCRTTKNTNMSEIKAKSLSENRAIAHENSRKQKQ